MAILTPSLHLPHYAKEPHGTVKASGCSAPELLSQTEACRLAMGVARGDAAAFQELYDRYHVRLFRFALGVGRGDESLAHETVQSVFITAAAKLRRIENEEHLWNWLSQVARQYLSKRWRQQRRDSAIVAVANLPEYTVPHQSGSDLEESLDAALLRLAPEDHQLIEWYYFDGLSHKTIGERLNATQKAVSSRLERARARLRLLLPKRTSS
jgi:RNA polymerase sigma-70 factor, ECF subfamily